tara:strand:+ start:1479 stop:2555 length:1077 start_codon:yes stop_codon:yes gene_type:complete
MKFNSSQHRSLLQEAMLALNENRSVLRKIDPKGTFVRIGRQLARKLGGGKLDAQRFSNSEFVMTVKNDIDSVPESITDPLLELGLSGLMKGMIGRAEEEEPLALPNPFAQPPEPEEPEVEPFNPNPNFDFENRKPYNPNQPGGGIFDPTVISPFAQDPNNPPPPPTDPLTGFPQEGEYIWFGGRWIWIPEGGLELDSPFLLGLAPNYGFTDDQRDIATEVGQYFDDLSAQQEIANVVNDIPGMPISFGNQPIVGPGVPGSPNISPPGIDWDFDGDIDEDEMFKAIKDGEIQDWDDLTPYLFGENWSLELNVTYNLMGDQFDVEVNDDEVIFKIYWIYDFEDGRWKTSGKPRKRKEPLQ